MSSDLNRRDFLSTTAAGGVAAWSALHPAIRTAKGAMVAANEKVVVALIGCGGMGTYDLEDFMRAPDVSIAALCDIDDSHLESTAAKVEKKYGKKPKTTR